MSSQEMERELARLRAENERLKQSKTKMQVSDSGYVEIYGLPKKGRFSVSLTPEGWDMVFAMTDDIKSFCKSNAEVIKSRQQSYISSKAAG